MVTPADPPSSISYQSSLKCSSSHSETETLKHCNEPVKSGITNAEQIELTSIGNDAWSRQDKLLVTLNTLVKCGDSIEIYLPGIITQVLRM